MQRRTLLAAVGAATLPLAGCTAEPDAPDAGGDAGTPDADSGTDTPNVGTTDADSATGTPTIDGGTDTTDGDGGTDTTDDGGGQTTDVPEECPTSQDFGVEWPERPDASTVESFVEEYERVYYRDVVVAYEPESRLDSYGLAGSVMDPPRAVGDGWVLAYSGNGGIYRPTLALGATVSDPPDGADPIPVEEIDDGALTATLEDAAGTGEAEYHVDPPGEEVDRYLDLLASLSDEFGELSGPGDSDTLYVDVGDTTVELSVTATNFHGDYWWDARYYVDERVVRRTDDEDTDPRDGELLECRRPGSDTGE